MILWRIFWVINWTITTPKQGLRTEFGMFVQTVHDGYRHWCKYGCMITFVTGFAIWTMLRLLERLVTNSIWSTWVRKFTKRKKTTPDWILKSVSWVNNLDRLNWSEMISCLINDGLNLNRSAPSELWQPTGNQRQGCKKALSKGHNRPFCVVREHKVGRL